MTEFSWHQEGLEAFRLGEYERASERLKQALAGGETAELWNDWATAELAAGRTTSAAEGYRRALALDPDAPPAALNLGLLLLNQGETPEAHALLRKALPKLPAIEQEQVQSLIQSAEAKVAADADPAAAGDGHLRVLLIHEMLPEFDRAGADQRLMQVLREFRAQGHAVTLVARNGSNRGRYTKPLEEMGIRVFADDAPRLRYLGVDRPAAWKLEDVLQQGRFHLVILYHWFWTGIPITEHYLHEVRRGAPGAVVAVLTEDRHGDREMRLAELSGLWSDWERALDFGEREIEAYRAADLVLSISEEDRRGLLQKAPELDIAILPSAAEDLIPPPGATPGPTHAEREGFLFLGNFDNLANRDGLNWFIEHVWPRVRKRQPEATLFVAGNNMPVDFAAGVAGVAALGYVADLEALFARHRVFLAPVRYGTGIKTKILNALAHGLPVVTTTSGADGMNLSAQSGAVVRDAPEDLAEAACLLYADAKHWQTLSDFGPPFVRREYPREKLRQSVESIVARARQITPKTSHPDHLWSALRVESHFPEVLSRQPAAERTALRVFACIRLAETFIAQHDAAAGRRQLRHVFAFLRHPLPGSPFFRNLFERMAAAYELLGDADGAERFRREFDSRPAPRTPAGRCKPRRENSPPEISVVIPTFNRVATLRQCLDALNRQTLAPERFEVVVVDDGSSDGTSELLHDFPSRFRLEIVRQMNRGAGAARRAGVERARGELVALFNDDTIANPRLLDEHLAVQRAPRAEKVAVLGDFRLPPAARRRALTHFLNTQPFLFPQANLPAGWHDKNSYFISCNLSLRREAILRAGNFDGAFRVAEDTELGLRLRQAGYRVLYHPAAWAWHEHTEFRLADLLRRARAYGAAQLQLLRKHPALLGAGDGPFGRLDAAAMERLRAQLESERADVARAAAALEIFDTVDFLPLFSQASGERTVADDVMELFCRAIPRVFYHALYEAFLEAASPLAPPSAAPPHPTQEVRL